MYKVSSPKLLPADSWIHKADVSYQQSGNNTEHDNHNTSIVRVHKAANVEKHNRNTHHHNDKVGQFSEYFVMIRRQVVCFYTVKRK